MCFNISLVGAEVLTHCPGQFPYLLGQFHKICFLAAGLKSLDFIYSCNIFIVIPILFSFSLPCTTSEQRFSYCRTSTALPLPDSACFHLVVAEGNAQGKEEIIFAET